MGCPHPVKPEGHRVPGNALIGEKVRMSSAAHGHNTDMRTGPVTGGSSLSVLVLGCRGRPLISRVLGVRAAQGRRVVFSLGNPRRGVLLLRLAVSAAVPRAASVGAAADPRHDFLASAPH